MKIGHFVESREAIFCDDVIAKARELADDLI